MKKNSILEISWSNLEFGDLELKSDAFKHWDYSPFLSQFSQFITLNEQNLIKGCVSIQPVGPNFSEIGSEFSGLSFLVCTNEDFDSVRVLKFLNERGGSVFISHQSASLFDFKRFHIDLVISVESRRIPNNLDISLPKINLKDTSKTSLDRLCQKITSL